MKLSIALLGVLVLLPLAACKPHDNTPGNQQGRGQIGRLCRDDMQKLCPNLTGHDRRKCLRDNLDKLSDDCKTALKERMEQRRKRKNRD